MKHFVSDTSLKTISFLCIFFANLQAAILSVGFLIMIDTFLAIWAVWRHHGVGEVTSRKMGRIITKIILYPLALIVAKVAQEYLAPAIPWIEVTAGIIATVEVKSIFEKISLLLGFDLWARVKRALWPDKPEDITPKI